MKLSDNLKLLRKENSLSQEEFAEVLGISRQSVSKWESGISYPEMEKMLVICKKYNYTLDELINGKIAQKENKNSVKSILFEFLNWISKLINLFLRMTFGVKI